MSCCLLNILEYVMDIANINMLKTELITLLTKTCFTSSMLLTSLKFLRPKPHYTPWVFILWYPVPCLQILLVKPRKILAALLGPSLITSCLDDYYILSPYSDFSLLRFFSVRMILSLLPAPLKTKPQTKIFHRLSSLLRVKPAVLPLFIISL